MGGDSLDGRVGLDGRDGLDGRQDGHPALHPAYPAHPACLAYRLPVNPAIGIGFSSIDSMLAALDPSASRSPFTVNGGSPGPAPTCSTPSNRNVLPVHAGLIGDTKRMP